MTNLSFAKKLYWILVILVAIEIVPVRAQTSAFTYQGKLTDGGSAASGQYDFSFKLFAASSGGSQIGSDFVVEDVQVSNGIFTVTLDFGSSPFVPPGGTHLEIAVRPGASTGPYTTLLPRQPITSAPYAIQSLSATLAADSQNLGGVAADQYVQTSDARLTDARDPLPGSSNYIQNTNSTQAGVNFTIGGAGSANILNAATQFNLGGTRIMSRPGTNNMFVGTNAGANNTSGQENSFFGATAGGSNTTGLANSFFGAGAGFNNITGNNNSFYGTSSGVSNTTGSGNTYVGLQAGQNTTTGSNNSFFGWDAGFNNLNGNNLTLIGAKIQLGGSPSLQYASAFGANATVATNDTIVLGKAAGTYDGVARPADTVLIPGTLNVIGSFGASIFNATAQYNLGGVKMLFANGPYNDGVGTSLSFSNTFTGEAAGINTTPGGTLSSITGKLNAFYGANAGKANTTGEENSFFGFGAGANNTSGFVNTFVGHTAGFNNTTGNDNTFVGLRAGVNNTTGTDNAFFGKSSGLSNTTEDLNTFIGTNADGQAGITNATAIGNKAKVTQSNSLVLGSIDGVNNASASTNVGIGTTAPTAALDVRGDIRLGTTGQYLAPGGIENLQVLRGVISGGGTTLAGSGFTVSHTATGTYTVTYSTGFTGLPAVTANVESGSGAARLVTLQGTTTGAATILISVPNTGALADGAFHFIAIGPR